MEKFTEHWSFAERYAELTESQQKAEVPFVISENAQKLKDSKVEYKPMPINYGFRKSKYQPIDERAKSVLLQPKKDLDVCFKDYGKAKMAIGAKIAYCGKKEIHCWLKMMTWAKRHSWKAGDVVVLPASRFGVDTKSASTFVDTLESLGLIQAVTSQYSFYGMDKQDMNVAIQYMLTDTLVSYVYILTNLYTNLTYTIPSYIKKEGGSKKRGGSNQATEARHQQKLLKKFNLHTIKDIQKNLMPLIALDCDIKGSNIGAEWSDNDIEVACDLKYGLKELQELHTRYDVVSYRTCVSIKRDKYGRVTKIGCRPNNYLCQTRNEDKCEESIRKEEVKKLLGSYHHVDVSCSIYNVCNALCTGKFTNQDFYTLVGNELGLDRKTAKNSFMKANFGQFTASILEGTRKDTKLGDTNRTYSEFHNAFTKVGLQVQGRDTSVFLWEDYLYTLTQKHLIDSYGVSSTRVYDSFYTDREITEEQLVGCINDALQDLIELKGNEIYGETNDQETVIEAAL